MTHPGNAAVARRIQTLQWRTTGVGWAAALLVVGAIVAGLLTLGAVGRLLTVVQAGQPVDFHVPAALRHADGLPMLSLLFAGLALLAAWGLSTGRLRRSHAHLACALCVLTGAADFMFAGPLHQPLFGLPSRLERMVADGDYTQAEALIGGAGDGSMSRRQDYVRAQIALHAGDTKRLQAIGRPLLEVADHYVYASNIDVASAHGYHTAMADLRIDVLAAIDRRLNGGPLSAAGIALGDKLPSRLPAWIATALTGAVAMGLVVVSVCMLLLWHRMRANVLRIIDLAL
jgi:hypothetical protein